MLLPNFLQSRFRLLLATFFLLCTAFILTKPFSPIRTTKSTFPSFAEEEYTYPSDPHHGAHNQSSLKRIAIIGAGASGCSAAWFMNRAGRVINDRTAKQVLGEIVVYDREEYIGGRTTTVYPHGDTNLRPIELGASIFVDANRHLVKGAKRFGLKTVDPDFGESGIGIWDGQQFLYTTATSKTWYANLFDTLSAIRRYGPLSPYRTQKAVKALLTKFSNLYNPNWLNEHGPANSIDEFVERVGLGQEYTTRRGDEWAGSAVGVGSRWLYEIMEGSTRTNYASDMKDIHALGSAVSMATGGAKSVEGGNFKVFEGMLKESGATYRPGEEVLDIVPLNRRGETPQFEVRSTVLASGEERDDRTFDLIFYAAPWFKSPKDYGIHGLRTHAVDPIKYQRYVHLHVTLFTTTRSGPSPSFFGLPEGSKVPNTILTSSVANQGDYPLPPPPFHSITWHGETYPGSGEYVVKVFSLTYLKDRFVHQMIEEEPTWILRKEWDSYPELRPRTTWPAVEPVKGVQYLASLEPWISTMETQTLSAREAVARVAKEWWGLGYGDCRGGADAWDWSCEE